MSATDPYNQGKDKVTEIKNEIRQMNIVEDEDDLTFKAAVVLMYGIKNNTVSYMKIKKATDYWWKEVVFILHNFRASSIINEYHWCVDFGETNTEAIVSFTLYAMAGAGEVIQFNPDNPTKEKTQKWEEFLIKSEYCYGQQVLLQHINMPLDWCIKRNESIKRNRNNGIPNNIPIVIDDNTPEWLLEKQKQFKKIASKI